MREKKKDTRRERIFITGGVLLTLLVTGIFVTGRIINRRAGQMSDHIVSLISESHCRLLQAELNRTEEALSAMAHFLQHHENPSETELRVLTSALLEVDPKAREIWVANGKCTKAKHYRRGPRQESSLHTESTEWTESETEMVREELQTNGSSACDSLQSIVLTQNGVHVWMLVRSTSDPAGRRCLCGIACPLPELYAYMTGQHPHSRSSAMLLSPDGIIVYHPDSLKLGRRIDAMEHDPRNNSDHRLSEAEAFRQVLVSGHSIMTTCFSDYLDMEEQRIYYPIQVAGQRWVAGIGIPSPMIEQEIDDFHRYTILTAAISVLLFAALLILAQRRWRREYTLRRLSEQESAQLQMQQVIEQIDPHFLFNSLNSLYALIRCNPEQARDFTLTLARVYRRVLERRKQILATLAEEIDFTWQYHSLQQIRFGESLTLTTTIDPSLRKLRIPAMSLQTLVENAVKHNRVSVRTPLHIDIRTEGNFLVIENNRTPREDGNDESLGVGLERIRSIYRFYTDRNLEIAIEEGCFRCRLPLLPAEE